MNASPIRICRSCVPGFSQHAKHLLGSILLEAKLSHHGQILHLTVRTGLVKLVRAQSRSSRRGIGLNRESFVEQSFVVQSLQQIPHGFDVFVVIGHVRAIQIDPIPHQPRQFLPFPGELHHIFPAMPVKVRDGNSLANILPSDAQFLLHLQFHRQAMGVPSAFAIHPVTLHGPIPTQQILDGPGHHMMNPGDTVGRRRSLVEDFGWPTILRHRLFKNLVGFPKCGYLGLKGRPIGLGMFPVSFLHRSPKIGKILGFGG